MCGDLTPRQVQRAEERAGSDGYVHKVLVALDQNLNVDAGGMPDETISSRVRRLSDAHPRWGWNPAVWLAKALNAGLNIIQRDHGQKAQAGDLARAVRAAEIEQKALGFKTSAACAAPKSSSQPSKSPR